MKKLLSFLQTIFHGTIIREETRMLYERDHPKNSRQSNNSAPRKPSTTTYNDTHQWRHK